MVPRRAIDDHSLTAQAVHLNHGCVAERTGEQDFIDSDLSARLILHFSHFRALKVTGDAENRNDQKRHKCQFERFWKFKNP